MVSLSHLRRADLLSVFPSRQYLDWCERAARPPVQPPPYAPLPPAWPGPSRIHRVSSGPPLPAAAVPVVARRRRERDQERLPALSAWPLRRSARPLCRASYAQGAAGSVAAGSVVARPPLPGASPPLRPGRSWSRPQVAVGQAVLWCSFDRASSSRAVVLVAWEPARARKAYSRRPPARPKTKLQSPKGVVFVGSVCVS